MFKALFKRHSSGIMVSSTGAVFVPARHGLKAHWSYGSGAKWKHVKIKGICYLVHRLVGETFIPNPQNLPQWDHIDRDPSNNVWYNLRPVTAQMNRCNTDNYDACFAKYGIHSSDDRSEYQRRYRNTPEGRARIKEYNKRAKDKKTLNSEVPLCA